MINYRKATVNDSDILAKIRSIFIVEVVGCSETERIEVETANKIYFEKALADDSFAAWIALDDDKIVATSGLSFSVVPPAFKFDGKLAYIMNMFTFPEYRNQGIGTELLKRVVEEAKNRGYKIIKLNATEMGRPLYEKYEFKDSHGEMIFNAE